MNSSVRLVQLVDDSGKRKLALVDEPDLIVLAGVDSVYSLAGMALKKNLGLIDLIEQCRSGERISYDEVYSGKSSFSILPSFDVPGDPFRCLVAGTGLTHKNSALNRQMMHQDAQTQATDSMKIYQWGVEGGWPADGQIGVQPEWFYKGSGEVLRGHAGVLAVPAFGNDGGEEPEVAGVYIVDNNGIPRRIGFTTANEFSDHVMEKKNYLYLAPSKLRNCAIGPELVIDASFESLSGVVSVSRNGEQLWKSEVRTGEHNMAHSLSNLEYHHFKYSGHRIPGQAHVHFFGADAFSFGAGIALKDGDEMVVEWKGMGRPLRNTIRLFEGPEEFISVKSIADSL